MATATEKELQQLKAEFASLKEELANIGDTVGRIASSATESGQERVRSAAKKTQRQAQDRWQALESEIEERPMTSVAAALGIGFLLGRLLDR